MPTISLRLSDETRSRLTAIEQRLGVNTSTAVRVALESLHNSLIVESPEVAFSGDEDEVKLKWEAIQLTREHKGPAVVAKELSITRDTIECWESMDPVFARLMAEAWDYSIELADHVLWHMGVRDGNVKATFGTLNAHHPDHGIVRREFIEQRVRTMVEKEILPIVASRLSGDDLESVQRQLAAHFGLESLEGAQESPVQGESRDS